MHITLASLSVVGQCLCVFQMLNVIVIPRTPFKSMHIRMFSGSAVKHANSADVYMHARILSMSFLCVLKMQDLCRTTIPISEVLPRGC